jgi:hypothetical protein
LDSSVFLIDIDKKERKKRKNCSQHAVIKHWGLSGLPSALLAGKFSNGG